ncbi:putative cytosolic protein [Smithella sp. ME-1]|uniref:Uncharacterized protein n=1 Tax=hydrocarbon metagenome TaxID=938273 RepID=A0A0W8FPV9_9ZZZZ|nr:putative cytosolic protein [Smithella sp. ME-1]
MTKQRKEKTWIQESDIKHKAELLLKSIMHTSKIIEQVATNYNATVDPITEKYLTEMGGLKNDLAADEKELISLMKKNKAILFDGTDVVNLTPGSLIREKGDKVKLPKGALAECERLKFDDVIKIVKSLDRPAIEKWPDAKLVLIGAERKPSEEFKYNLKNVKSEK